MPPEAEQTKHYEYYDGVVQTKLADWMCNLEKCILAEMLAKLNGSWVFWVFFGLSQGIERSKNIFWSYGLKSL